MGKIVRLTESDLVRIVKRVINEGFAQNTPLDFASVAGYKSALFPQLEYNDDGWDLNYGFAGTKTLGNLMGMKDGSFQSAAHEPDPTSISQRTAFNVKVRKIIKTRAEVETAVKNITVGGQKDPFKIKAGGTSKNSKGQTITWGRPGFTAGSEMVDAICKIMNITA
jgi:hypothetical protein